MLQVKIFRVNEFWDPGPPSDRAEPDHRELENDVNQWLADRANRIIVINVSQSSSKGGPSGKDLTHFMTILYELKPES